MNECIGYHGECFRLIFFYGFVQMEEMAKSRRGYEWSENQQRKMPN